MHRQDHALQAGRIAILVDAIGADYILRIASDSGDSDLLSKTGLIILLMDERRWIMSMPKHPSVKYLPDNDSISLELGDGLSIMAPRYVITLTDGLVEKREYEGYNSVLKAIKKIDDERSLLDEAVHILNPI